MQNTIQQLAQGQYSRFGFYLNSQHFLGTVLLALMLHLGGILIYQIMPKEAVEMIPVRVLNVKLGNALPIENPLPVTETLTETSQIAPKPVVVTKSQPKPLMPKKETASLPKPRVTAAEKPMAKQMEKPMEKPLSPVVFSKPVAVAKTPQLEKVKSKPKTIADAAKEQSAKHYVREDTMPTVQYDTADGLTSAGTTSEEAGSPLGNSTAESAEIEKRYTQTLSLWINRFKIYPMEARQAGIGGTVMLRLRIDRQGKVLRYVLERASGYPVIDQAISTMVNAANPVPAVPANYPDSRPYLEFLIPIHFQP
jgi:protein TonB